METVTYGMRAGVCAIINKSKGYGFTGWGFGIQRVRVLQGVVQKG